MVVGQRVQRRLGSAPRREDALHRLKAERAVPHGPLQCRQHVRARVNRRQRQDAFGLVLAEPVGRRAGPPGTASPSRRTRRIAGPTAHSAVARRGVARGLCKGCAVPRRFAGRADAAPLRRTPRRGSPVRPRSLAPRPPGRSAARASRRNSGGRPRTPRRRPCGTRPRRRRTAAPAAGPGEAVPRRGDRSAAPWSGGGRGRRRPRPATRPWSRSGAPGRGRSGRQASWFRHIQKAVQLSPSSGAAEDGKPPGGIRSGPRTPGTSGCRPGSSPS